MDSVEILVDNAKRLQVPLSNLCDQWGWDGGFESRVGVLGQPGLAEHIIELREKLTELNDGRLACTRLVRAYAEQAGLPEPAIQLLVRISTVMGFDSHHNCACVNKARRKWGGQ